MQKQINYWQKKFRILKDWEITYYNKTEHSRSATCNYKKKKTLIYKWDKGRPRKEYIFHEILHICQRIIIEKEDHYERRELEEIYIQDVCEIFRKFFVGLKY